MIPDLQTDSSPAFQLRLDEAATKKFIFGVARKCGEVCPPPGVFMLRSQLVVPSGVHFVGAGAQSTYLWADQQFFPPNTAVIKLGRTEEEGDQASCTIERMTINCGSGLIPGSVGVDMTGAQEHAGAIDCNIMLFKNTGILVNAGANTVIRNVIVDDYNQGSNYGIHYVNTGGDNLLDKATVMGAYTGSAVRVYGSHVHINAMHVEGHRDGGPQLTYGLDVDTSAVSAVSLSGHSSITTLVRIKNDSSAPERFVGINLLGGGVTNMIRDETDTVSTLPASTCSGKVGLYLSHNTPLMLRGGAFKLRTTGDPSLTHDGLAIHSGEIRGSTNIRVSNAACSSSAAPTGVLLLGSYQLWVDNTGKLRMKNGAPANSTDGTIVGTQA